MWLLNKLFGKKANEDFNKEVEVKNCNETVASKKEKEVKPKPQAGNNQTSTPVTDTAPANATSSESQHATPTAGAQGEASVPSNVNVYHLIVLDESGSMGGITQQTISGCNETIQTVRAMKEKNADQQHFVSIYLFDSGNSRYIIKNKEIENVREITHRDYCPNACTPLFDALGTTLTELKGTISKEASLAYVTIITDGYENASREYNLAKVRALITELKAKDVIFSFIGANVDSASYASSLDINNYMQFDQTNEGTRDMWARERRAKMRSSSKFAFMREHNFNSDCFGAGENRGNYYNTEVPEDRISSDNIQALAENEIFVFGSNPQGNHSGGASYQAVRNFGAVMGQAEGRQGQCYAIPSDGVSEKGLYCFISNFCNYAEAHPELTFLVTLSVVAWLVAKHTRLPQCSIVPPNSQT